MRERLFTLLRTYLKYINEDVSPRDPEVKETIKELSAINEAEPELMKSYTKEAAEITAAIQANPKYANRQTMQEIAGSIEGAVDLFNTFSNLSTARRQISDAETAAAGLQKPEVPSLTPKSAELQEATLDARLQSRGRIREIDPILQRNLDLMRSGLNVAKTASTGQAGIYGSLGQAAINQAQRANMAAIPEIERVKRSRDARYDSLIRAGMSEDLARGQERQSIYGNQYQQYIDEAGAIGALGSAGHYNLAAQRQDVGGQLGSMTSGILNNMRFSGGGTNYGTPPTAQRATLQDYTTLGNLNPKYDALNDLTNSSLASYYKNK
jgi:hypothetical protein